jgi:hypothetical protein
MTDTEKAVAAVVVLVWIVAAVATVWFDAGESASQCFADTMLQSVNHCE